MTGIIFYPYTPSCVPSPRVEINGKRYLHDYRKDFSNHPTSGYDGHRWEWKTIINLITND